MADYPGSIPSFTTLVDNVDDVLASHQNTPNGEITAIATELGTNPKTISDAVAPGASPSSVANYLDMVATILKAISGAANWYQANVAAIMKSIGTTKGDIIAFTASGTPARRAIGTDNQVLTADSAQSDGMKWASAIDPTRIRYIITPSVASSNLTIAIKYIDTGDPSSANKLTFRIGDTEYDVTAATSFTKNAGTNWCNAGGAELAAQNIDFFMYAIGETGASAGIKFGFSRIPYATVMGDFVNTSTDQKYIAGNWTNFNATDAVTNIGRFRAQLSATAAFNWSIPSALVINKPMYDTDWSAWTPAITGFSVNPTLLVFYKVQWQEVIWIEHATGAGTSNATTSTITLPFTAVNVTNLNNWSVGRGQDNGVECSPVFRIVYNTSTLDIYKGPGNTAWTAAGTKFYSGQGFYRIA